MYVTVQKYQVNYFHIVKKKSKVKNLVQPCLRRNKDTSISGHTFCQVKY